MLSDTICEHIKFIPNGIFIYMRHNNFIRMAFLYIE